MSVVMLKRVLWIAIPLALLGAFWLFSRTRPVPVDVGVVTRGPIRSVVEEEGQTRVIDRFVVSAPVGVRLLRVDLLEGDAVKQGEVVARVDPLPLKTSVEEVRAQIQGVREQMDGVQTKLPKPEEIERAKVGETQAEEAEVVAQRELDRATANWERLGKDLERARELARERIVAASELDAAVAAESAAHEEVRAQEVRIRIARLATAAARLNHALLESRLHDFDWEKKAYAQQITGLEASLERLEDDLKRTEIHAPVTGVVLRVLQESETVVTPGTPILELGDVSRLEVQVDYLSEDAAHMRKGMKAEIFGRALGDRVLDATLDRIEPSGFKKISSLGVEQQRVYVILAFDPAGSGLGDRYRVEARVVLDEHDDVVLVPEGALFRRRDAWYAFAVEGEHARLRRVETGLRNGRTREVLDGLSPGERVVLHPGDAIDEGTPVEVLETLPKR